MKLSHTSRNSVRKGNKFGKSRKAIARLMEAMEPRILMATTDWLSVPTAEWRQPTPNVATQIELQGFPAATVVSNGSLQYTTSWVANSYGGYDVTAPDGGVLTYNLVQRSSEGVAAGPLAADGTYLMGFANGYAEEGNCFSVYQDGAALSTNDEPGKGGGRGIVFGDSHAPYAFQSMNNHDKDTNIEYYTVERYNLQGQPANFTSGVGTGQDCFGLNTLSGQENYIYSHADKGWQPSALGYFYNTATSTPTLYVSDNLNNVIYMFNAVTGTPISTAGVNGVILNPASSSNQTLTVSDGTHSITSGNINVVKTAITTARLGLATITNSVAAAAFSLTVTAFKSDGSIDTGYNGTVHFTSTDGQVSAGNGLPADTNAFVNGVLTVNVTLKTAGNQTITVTDATNGLQAIATTPITVTGAAAAASFSITTLSGVAQSSNFPFTLTVKDAYGNTATGYTGTVHFSSTDGTATLPANYTFKSGDKGVSTWTSTKLGTQGSWTITVADTVNGTLTATTPSIAVGPTDVTHSLSISGISTQTTAGTSFSITVTALKGDGVTTDTTNNHTVHLTSSDSQAQVWNGSAWVGLSSYTPSFTAGVLTLTNGLQLRTAGSQTITAIDWADQSAKSIDNPTTVVNTGSVDHLTISTPTIAQAGSPFNVTVTAQDLYNNPVTSYTGTVHFTSSDGNANLPGITIGGTAHSYTFIAQDQGVRKFVSGSLAITDPYDMAFDNNGYLWVATSTGGVTQYNVTTGAPTGKTIAGLPAAPNNIAWDSQRGSSGELVVAITGRVGTGTGGSNTTAPIYFYDVSGTPTQTGTFGSSVFAGTPGEMGVSKLSDIVDIDVDGAGNLYVAMDSHPGDASADVRVLSLSGSYSSPTGAIVYAEVGRTAGPSATPVTNPTTGADEMYTLDGQFAMNYNAPMGDQWTWTGITFDPGACPADIRNLPGFTSSANTPIVRYLNGHKYMYMVGTGKFLEIYEQDANDYLFRPVALLSVDQGDSVGDGTGSFENHLEPTNAMWIWTDTNGNGAFDSGEFNPYTGTGNAWSLGFGDVLVDNSGDLFFSVGKAYGNSSYGPAVVQMSIASWSNGNPVYNFNDNTHTLRTLAPTNDTGLPGGYAAWGQTSGTANDIGYLAYDQANDILYLVGGPSNAGEGGKGTVLRGYKNWSTISHDSNGLGDLTNYNNDPNHLAWSISPGWINPTDDTTEVHVLTAVGGYLFIETRGTLIYDYYGTGSQGGTLAGNIVHPTMTTMNAFPDNAPPFQAMQRSNGDIILTTEGFYSETFFRVIAPGNHSPTASFSQDIQASAQSPATVTFTAVAGDPDGDSLTYTWQFGDGTTDHTNSPTISHTYSYNGAFNVDLTVGDGKGGYADAVSTVTVGPAVATVTMTSMTADGSIDDLDSTGDGAGVADDITDGGVNVNLGGISGATKNYCDIFPFDLWAAGLRPGDHVSTATLPNLSFVLASITGAPANADLYAMAMENTLHAGMSEMGWMYYAGSGDTSAGAVMVQKNFLTSSSPVGTRISINPAAALVLANYINAALDAGNRYIVLRLSPQNLAASASYYSVDTSDTGSSTRPQLSVTPVQLPAVPLSNTSSYSVLNSALAAGLSQYGNSADSSVTFTTIPAKYLGASYIRTDNSDKATSTTNGSTLQFTINQTATVYVAYDDALSAHKPAWLTSGFTDTNDNIVTTAGTFSVYKNNADYAAGMVSLGANTSDGSSIGHMYSVLIAPTALQSSNLVGWWKFEEGTGTAATDAAPTGTAENGTVTTGGHTISGVPVWQDGYQGNAQHFDDNMPGAAGGPSPVGLGQTGTALHFDGTDYVSITDNGDLHPASNVSVSLWATNDAWQRAWVERNGWQASGYLISSPNFYIQPQLTFTTGPTYPGGANQTFPDAQHSVYVCSGQQMIFAVNTSGGWKTLTYMVPGNDPSFTGHSYKNDFDLFQWHQYGLTFSTASGGTLTAYVDGVAVKTLTNCGTLTTTSGNVGIGGNGTAGNYFQGAIDDVRLYKTALAATDMQALGNLGVGESAVAGAPTAIGAATALKVTGVTGMASAAVTIAAAGNATEGSTNGSFTVTRTGSTSSPLTVHYLTGGAATNGSDCALLPGVVTIPAGQSSATITVTALGDHAAELTETLDLTLAAGTGYYISSPATAEITITNAASDTVNFLGGSNLVGYWRLDEGSGNTVYDSAPVASPDNSSAITTTSWVAGYSGNGLYFSNSNNYTVTINDNNGNLHPASMSVALWAQSNGSTWNKSTALILGNNNFEILPIISTTTVTFGIYAGSSFQTVSYTPTFDITTWHQYGLTYNDSTKVLTAYVDGAAVGTKSISGTRPTVSSTVTLGKLGTNYLKGTLDEITFYNTAISPADISTLYNQVAPRVAIAGVSGSNAASYGTALSALKAGVTLYGDAANTFSTFPGNSSKYLGSTLIKTASADAASTSAAQLGVTVNTNSIVYVLYDDAITGSHRADYSGGWLSQLTDTGDNITDSSGHTFSIYKKNVSAGTIWLGGNTADGVNGTGLMYDVLVQPLTTTNTLSVSTASSTVAGTPLSSVTVTARNPNGTTATGYTGTVHFTSTDGQAVLPSDYTFVSGDNGVHTFTNAVTLKTAGNQAIVIADTATGMITGNATVAVSSSAASTFGVSTVSSATAGSAFSLTLTAKDPNGNTATGYTGTVHFTSTDGQAALPSDYTFVSGDNGVHTFTSAVTLKTAGNQTVTATDTVTGSINGTSGNVVVSAAAASQTVITTQPSSSATAGTAFATQPVVKLEDVYGNVCTNDSTHTVTAASNGSALLQGTLTVTLVNGVATFTNLSYNKAETMTIGFSNNVGGINTVTSNNVVVSPAAASQLVITQQPSATATVGVAFATQPIVQMRDAYNNVITSDSTHTVTAARYTGTGALQGTTTVTEVNGVATFTNLSYNTAETMNIRFSSNLGGVSTADSTNVVVSPGTVPVTIAAAGNATEGGSNGSFTVTRTGTSGDLVVNYSIGGSAVNGTDDTALSGTVTILNGSSTATITVAATNDTVAELTETVDLTLTSGTGYTIGSPNYATINIIDNDSAAFLRNSNLVGYWRLDEGTGTTASDAAPVATPDTGTATSANWGTGHLGNAYHGNKTSNYYISIPNSTNLNPSTALTVSAWAKCDTGPGWSSSTAHAFVYKNNSYQILPVASGGTTTTKFEVKIGSTWYYAQVTPTIDVSQWHQYAMTWDGSTITAYVDGTSLGTAAASGTITSNTNALLLGADGTGGAAAFNGYVDEVRLYNAAISSSDISTLYNQTALSVTGLTVAGSHGASYSVASNLQSGNTLYGDAANTFSTVPAKYLGSTLLKTANADANSVGDKQLGFTLNQNSIVYVLYDDAIASGHRASDTGGWLASGNGFTDTGDNVVDSSGHTFSVYKASVSAGTLWLGGNTLDGVNGTGLMYDVLIQPLL